jgi:hypothetical protein
MDLFPTKIVGIKTNGFGVVLRGFSAVFETCVFGLKMRVKKSSGKLEMFHLTQRIGYRV